MSFPLTMHLLEGNDIACWRVAELPLRQVSGAELSRVYPIARNRDRPVFGPGPEAHGQPSEGRVQVPCCRKRMIPKAGVACAARLVTGSLRVLLINFGTEP